MMSTKQARRRLMLRFVLGAGIGTAVSLVVVVIMLRDPTPPLTGAALDQAIDRWQKAGIDSYDLDVSISGGQQGQVEIAVRDGEVESMSYNSRRPTSHGQRAAWTVPEMFLMLDRELALAESVTDGPAAALRASFDPETGLPLRYRRLRLGDQGTIRWDVTRFEPVGKPSE